MLFSSSLSWAASCSTSFMALALLILYTALKWPILVHFVYFFPYARHCLVGWLLPQYLHICFAGLFVCMYLLGLSLCVFFTIFSLSNSSSVRLFMMVDGVLCASTLFIEDNTFSVVIFFHFQVSMSVPGLFLLIYQCHLNHE